MKKTYTKRRSIAAIALMCVTVASVLFYACKKPTEGIKAIVNSSSLFPAPTLFKFMNADTISSLQPGASNFAVTISGPGAKYVQMASGGTDFKATSGLLSVALTKDAQPSVANPIVFTLTASIPGFAPITQNVSITKNALTVIPVKAVEYAHLPVGTTGLIGVENNTLTAGTLPTAAPYLLTTPKTATMNEQATISFQAGTAMQDANGNTINGTVLKSNIVQYGTGTDASLQAFPGGLTAPIAYKSDGSQIAGGVNFVTAGLLQMNLTVNGTEVKKFSKPATVTIDLNNNLINFATGLAMQAGQKIPVWSMNESTGVWTNEADATVITQNGRLAAQFTVSHLSIWNLDWTWGIFGAYTNCGGSLNVTINTSDPAFAGGPYEVTLQTPWGQYLGALHGVTISNGLVVTFPALPNIPLAKIVVSGGIPYTRVQTSTFNTCSVGSVTVAVPVGNTNPIGVNVNIKGICSGKDIVILPTASFELYQQVSGSQGQGSAVYADAGTFQLTNGIGTTTLQVGKQYYFVTVYNGTTYKTDPFSVSKSDIAIPSTTSTLSASATYNASNNTLNIVGTIPVNCN